jgi:hypothetical protein
MKKTNGIRFRAVVPNAAEIETEESDAKGAKKKQAASPLSQWLQVLTSVD